MSDVLELDQYNNPNQLNEAGLSRIHQHTKESPIGVITAFRGENSLQKNKALNQKLKGDIRAAGYGFVKLIGRYVEGYGSEDETPVDEISFLVIGNKGQSGNLKGFLKKMGVKYRQDSVLFKNEENDLAVLIGTGSGYPAKGTQKKLGKFHPQRMGEFYSKMRGQTFTFESYQHASNNMSRFLK
jgi:hypothetical protein